MAVVDDEGKLEQRLRKERDRPVLGTMSRRQKAVLSVLTGLVALIGLVTLASGPGWLFFPLLTVPLTYAIVVVRNWHKP